MSGMSSPSETTADIIFFRLCAAINILLLFGFVALTVITRRLRGHRLLNKTPCVFASARFYVSVRHVLMFCNYFHKGTSSIAENAEQLARGLSAHPAHAPSNPAQCTAAADTSLSHRNYSLGPFKADFMLLCLQKAKS